MLMPMLRPSAEGQPPHYPPRSPLCAAGRPVERKPMFNVFRDQSALTLLRRAWEQGDDPLRAAIVRAMDRVDRTLQSAPHHQGESRQGGERILFADPVAVVFAVDDEQRLVRILRAWVYRQPPQRHDQAA